MQNRGHERQMFSKLVTSLEPFNRILHHPSTIPICNPCNPFFKQKKDFLKGCKCDCHIRAAQRLDNVVRSVLEQSEELQKVCCTLERPPRPRPASAFFNSMQSSPFYFLSRNSGTRPCKLK